MSDEKYGIQQNVEKLNIQPPASIYGTFARYNYKMWYAIAEFVDNSTANFFKNEKNLRYVGDNHLNIDIVYDSNSETLTITDNAYGMEIEDFRRAIVLNSKPENADGRNEFGMGLKTAASWFGKVWKVTSTEYGSPRRYTATVDIPRLDAESSNEVDIVTTSENPDVHGTVITISKLNRKIEGPKTIAKIKDVLRSMYRRDLDTGKITIRYNGAELHFKPYDVLKYKGQEWKTDVDYFFEFDNVLHHVTGFVGILGEDSGFIKAGLALFRRNRVVIGSEGDYYKPHGIFGQVQSHVSMQLFGEINLDDFQINQAKDGFVWDDGLEDAFVASLKVQILDYIKMARQPIKSREREFDPDNQQLLDHTREQTQQSLNRVRIGEESDSISDRQSETGLSEAELEFQRNFVDGPDPEEIVYQQTENEYELPVGKDKRKVKVIWSDAGSAYWFEYDSNANEIKINIAHPFFKPYCSTHEFRNVLNKFVIALVMAERLAEDSSTKPGYAFTDDINSFINDLLRDLAK